MTLRASLESCFISKQFVLRSENDASAIFLSYFKYFTVLVAACRASPTPQQCFGFIFVSHHELLGLHSGVSV